MDIILMLIPAALMFSIVALLVFRWAVKSDQYDDMEGEAYRILMDDEDMIPGREKPPVTTDQITGETEDHPGKGETAEKPEKHG
ncbi:MAG: cbb3-type cytochrome oxidase assembly protein CcoS [Mariprofundaceae bacterium]